MSQSYKISDLEQINMESFVPEVFIEITIEHVEDVKLNKSIKINRITFIYPDYAISPETWY